MFERLENFLRDLPGGRSGGTGPRLDDPRVAAAALLYHVADADGSRHENELATLEQVMADQYGIASGELPAILAAGEAADQEAVDLYTFTSVLARSLDGEGKRDFVRLLWEVVYADGAMSELEDNLVWRIAELIGVDSRERVDLRRYVEQKSGR